MITMEQAKRYGNIHTEIMIDNGLIHDKEIREPLFDYLESVSVFDIGHADGRRSAFNEIGRAHV